MNSRTEHLRPQLHFTPARHWINDPNGLVWLDGEYHLFYQYNPVGDRWGEIGWGHAVSPDLLHWQELPMALPATKQHYVFSGSVVVDLDNRSGFGQGGQPPLVAVYTAADRDPEGRQTQHIAYSLDRGRQWQRYIGNPVLDLGVKDFRDPKVFWHAPSQRWVMVVVLPQERQALLFGSSDLRRWQPLSRFGPAGAVVGARAGIWECPDLIELPLPEGGGTAWVLKVDVFDGHPCGSTGGQVFMGQFDGTHFVPEGDAEAAHRWADWGSDFYAALSWANLPSAHALPLWLGWASNHRYAQQAPTHPWRGAMSLPRELSLRRRSDGQLALVQRPLSALASLRLAPSHWARQPLAGPGLGLLDGPDARCVEIELRLKPGASGALGLQVFAGADEATVVGYDVAAGCLFIDRSRSGVVPDGADFSGRREAPLALRDGVLALHLVLDHSLIEVFADDGAVVLTEQVFPSPGSHALRAWASGPGAELLSATVWPLRSVW